MAKRPEMLGAREGREHRFLNVFFCVVFIVILLIFAADFWFTQNYVLVIVDGRSMEDTLSDGDALYVSVREEVERGDIIVLNVTSRPDLFPHEAGEERFIIKRAIALEGDEIYAEGGIVYLKAAGESEFMALSEPYTKGETGDFGPVTVGEGEVFFLGDHRDNSLDSEENGCLPLSCILGVATDFTLAHIDLITGWVRFWHPGLV